MLCVSRDFGNGNKMGDFLILDVGSGSNPLKVEGKTVVHCDIGALKCIDVRCDAHYLPFRDRVFEIAYASHVIEHCLSPKDVVAELKRVAKNFVIIKVVNAKTDFSCDTHLYSWNPKTLKHFLQCFFSEVRIYSTIRFTPHKSIIKRLMSQLKAFITISICGMNEITAVCKC